MNQYTSSLHGGSKACIDHNRRIEGKEGKHSTIKKELTNNNLTLIDMDIKEAYHQLFDTYVEEYNKIHKYTQIEDYYKKILHDKKKHTHYEYIFGLGNIKNRVDDETFINIATDYIANFQDRNKNLYLIGAYIHLDEEATPHMHIDYIPYAHYNKGMRLQTASDKAFREMTGFQSKSAKQTAQIKWQEQERLYIKDLCQQHGIEVIEGDSKGKKSLSLEQYKNEQMKQELIQQQVLTQQQLNELKDIQKDCAAQKESLKKQLDKDLLELEAQHKEEVEQAEIRLNNIKRQMNQEYKDLQKGMQQLKDEIKQTEADFKAQLIKDIRDVPGIEMIQSYRNAMRRHGLKIVSQNQTIQIEQMER